PYSKAPPKAVAQDAAMESAVMKVAKDDSWGTKIDFQRALIAMDWSVTRGKYGSIRGRKRFIWVGGPAKTQERAGDCFYVLFSAYQSHMGGGSYGATRYSWAASTRPNKRKIRCEDDSQG
ncbi:MAG: hypothetical protein JRH20_02280, partial [Deltaproteobacteria bacterium]|nr:hypothetical protein [Deltaproteobacteria bacterium]